MPATRDDECCGVDEVAQAFAMANVLMARAHAGLAHLGVDDVWSDADATSPIAWLRSRVGMSPGDATRAVRLARLVGVAPTFGSAWRAGELSSGQVAAIRANVDDGTVALFVEQEAELVPVLVPLSVAGTTRAMLAWKALAEAVVERPEPPDPVGVVHHHELPDGTWRLDGTLGCEAGAVVDEALRVAADRPDALGDLPLTPSQRRAEALTEVCRQYLDHAALGRRGRRRRPHLHVVLDAEALLDGGRARVLGGGHLSSCATARLVCDPEVHRLVLGPRGEILDHGRGRRTVSAGLWSALVLRDGGCRHPGCDRPEAWCDAHHVVPFGRGGATSLSNLVLSCRRHHTRAHHPGWQQRLDPDGALHVTDPLGRVHTSHPRGP